MEHWEQWRSFITGTLSLPLDETALARFRLLLSELTAWNEKCNLVSFRDEQELLWRHFADSLAGLSILLKTGAQPGKTADIGTGAGLPGIPVHIALPATALTLMESIAKKCAFLDHMRETLGGGFTVLNERLEIIGRDPAHRERYDTVFSRAVAKMAPNLECALPLLRPGGRLVLYKTIESANGPDGVAAAGGIIALLGGRHTGTYPYDLPMEGGANRYCIVIIEKTGPGPAAYPRRVGVPEKKPLAIGARKELP